MDERKRGVSVNELQIFNNEEFGEIRTITKDNEPMFCLADVCKALEITHVTDVKKRMKKDGYARRRFMVGERRKHRRKLKKLISKMKNVDSLRYYYGYIAEKERLKGNTYKV